MLWGGIDGNDGIDGPIIFHMQLDILVTGQLVQRASNTPQSAAVKAAVWAEVIVEEVARPGAVKGQVESYFYGRPQQ